MTDQVARPSLADPWLEQLQATTGDHAPYLARTSNGQVVEVEGSQYREIPSGLLRAAVETRLGSPRPITDEELGGIDEGPPVEILEAPHGKPFVVIGGERISVRGLPLPHPVSTEQSQKFSQGPELNIAAANVPRVEFEEALSGRYQIKAARGSIDRRGLIPAVSSWFRRYWRRLGAS